METEIEYARRESRLRAKARRMGLKVQKARSSAVWNPYNIIDPSTNFVVAGGYVDGYGLSLGDVEDVLNTY